MDFGPGQTPYFTSNANDGQQRIFLICIRFGPCEARTLTPAFLHLGIYAKQDIIYEL